MTANHVDVVRDVRRLLDARGQKWETNCDAFEITGRVAWRLRDRGAVLIPKAPAQNGCTLIRGPHIGRRVSHDAIGFPDGWVDILVSGGPPANQNGPAWDWHDGPPSTGLAPWDLDAGEQQPGGGGSGGGTGTPPPPLDLHGVMLQLNLLTNLVDTMGSLVRATHRRLDEQATALQALQRTAERLERRVKGGVRGRAALNLHLRPDPLPEDEPQ